MRKVFLIAGLIILLVSCQQEILQFPMEEKTEEAPRRQHVGMARMKLHSKMELKTIADAIDNSIGEVNFTRTLASSVEFTDGSEEFVSLYEANRNEVFSQFTESDWEIINNDEDELEFELTDSVIADYRFAQMLNAYREIQVGDSVYRFFPNGVAVADEMHDYELDSISDLVSTITPSDSGQKRVPVTPNVDFIVPDQNLQDRPVNVSDGVDLGGGAAGGIGNGVENGPIVFRSGNKIEEASIREVDYDSKGDGNWFHRAWTGIWGKNVVALNKFSSNKQLNLNFYDQNYIIYSNIGTKLKMQKKVLGIWWNIKAEELIHGWELVCLDFTLPRPIVPGFPKDQQGNPIYPKSFPHSFPFQDESEVLIHIPLVDFDFTNKNLNDAFKKGCDLAWNRLESYIKSFYKRENVGLFSISDPHVYLFCGPTHTVRKNAKSTESKFYAQWLPGTYEFGFSIGGSFKLTKIKMDPDDHVALDCGLVFGAVKYKGEWKAARIVKKHKNRTNEN